MFPSTSSLENVGTIHKVYIVALAVKSCINSHVPVYK